ncbi:MAG TPA: sigma-70 family RNA polymerase sigma factor [Acidimicrobiales bacterium]|nr:sigma-70 family RNA polymerase sigma factor [Acidimicrobiales bacterium]
MVDVRERGAGRADDAELLALVAAGDRGAPLEELFARYAPRVYGLGLRLLGERGLAEELVQETFVRLWRAAARYDRSKGSVPTFVFTIARRLAIDLVRRPSSRPFLSPPAETDPERDPSGATRPGAPAEADSIVVGLVVRDALDSLTPAHRDVLELSYRSGLTQVEIARRLGLPLGTVKTRTYYALRALKLALEERGVDG